MTIAARAGHHAADAPPQYLRRQERNIGEISYSTGAVRYEVRVRCDGAQKSRMFATLDEARAHRDAVLAGRPQVRRAPQAYRDRPSPRRSDDTVHRTVAILGWTPEQRHEALDWPAQLDPISRLADALIETLGRHLTLDEIGHLYGLTRERIRQIESRALELRVRPAMAREWAP